MKKQIQLHIIIVSIAMLMAPLAFGADTAGDTQKSSSISQVSEEREVVVRPAPKRSGEREVVVRPVEAVEISSETSPSGQTEIKTTGIAEEDLDAQVIPPMSPIEKLSESASEKKDSEAGPLGPQVPQKKSLPEDQTIAVGAEAAQRNIVENIEVRGNQIISSGTILSKIRIKRGDPLLQETINDDIKRLYTSGFFQDIKVDVVKESPGRYRLIFTVDEKPVVRQIIIEGNESISEGKIRKEIHLIEGQIYDPKAVKEGVVAIRNLYQNKGYKFVEVKSELDVNDYTKEAVLYVLIDEGQKYQIKKVNFEGNHAFTGRQLRGLMRTKARFLLLLRTGVFHEDHFQNDLEKIRAFYIRNGFADVRLEPKFDYDRESKQMVITIQVEEGQVYHAGDIRIQGNVLYPESEIWEVLSMLPGDVYSQIALNDDIQAIQKFYFYQGYIAAQINPEIRFNRETSKVDIVYNIFEGDLFFVNKIKIRGNTKTKDMVIRRELRIRPGEKFDGQKVDRSKERLNNLGYFEDVAFETEEPEGITEPNVRDIIFKVKERQTGQISFGGGISSVEALIGFAEVSQNNFDLFNWPTFTGGGQRVFVRGRIGTKTLDIDFGFTEPYLFGMPYSYDLRMYATKFEKINVDYDDERIGFSNTFGHEFTEYIFGSTGLKLERVKLTDIDDDADPAVTENGTENYAVTGHATLVHDTRNNRQNPKRGHYLSLTSKITLGDASYYSFDFSFHKYWTLFRRHLLESKTRVGVSDKLGSNPSVPIWDRFYAGGIGSVRGYGYQRVGPKGQNGNPIGGECLVVQNIDYSFPIINNFKGVVFFDIGNVGPDSFDFFKDGLAVTAGPGIKINTPIGPMAFYYGYPLFNGDPDHKNGRFEFSIARAF